MRELSTDALAVELVKAGKAAPIILGPRRLPIHLSRTEGATS